MDDPRDRYGRPFHALIHERNGDGTPRLTKPKRRDEPPHLRLMRGAQGVDGERRYAALVDAGSAPGPAFADGRRDGGRHGDRSRRSGDDGKPRRRPGNPVVDDPPSDSTPSDPKPENGTEGPADPDPAEPWIPDEQPPESAGSKGDGETAGRQALKLVAIVALVGITAWLGSRWQLDQQQRAALGIGKPGKDAPAWMRLGHWLVERLMDPEARRQAADKLRPQEDEGKAHGASGASPLQQG